MYPSSATFNTKIKSNTRDLTWTGSIDLESGSVLSFDEENISSGSITRSISSQSLSIGTAYAGTLSMELILPGVSRYELYNGKISLSVSIAGATDTIPMGVFTISEAMQAVDSITIKAYDNMILFDDVPVSAAEITNVQSPYAWLTQICTACGVVLGSTSADIGALPNGARNTGFADVVTDVKTWRDVLGYLASYLGAYCYIGRDGKLYLETYGAVSADTVPANFRYSSELSDYRTTYDGIYGVYKSEGVQEYVPNTNTGGLVLDLGTNPFLQFTDETNRLSALGEIIDAWDGIYYVPYTADMPLVPTYDPGDVLTFVDNQAGAYDIGVITEITYNIGGTMSVTCSGDNPRLAQAQDRFSKTIAGLSAEYNNGQEVGGKDFWILSTTNTEAVTVGNVETQIAEIEYVQKTFGQKIEMVLTVDSVLSATAEVNIRMTVDDDTDLEMNVTESKSMIGERVFHCSNPQNVLGEGNHIVKVYMTVTDSPLLWSDIV